MTNLNAVLLLASLGMTAAAQHSSKDAPLPVPFRLEGDGHACSGYLRVTKTTLVWKSSFSTCKASGWTGQRVGDQWTLTMRQTPQERAACPIAVVTMTPMLHDPTIGVWEVTDYATTQAYRKGPLELTLGCSLQ